MQVSLAYADPDHPLWLDVEVPEGSTIADVIRQSGVAEKLGVADLEHGPVGIFGTMATPEDPVAPGDRVELYRPVPKDRRRPRT